MRVLRGLFFVCVLAALGVTAWYVSGHYELSDRLTGLFLSVQSWLPTTLDFDQFLVILTVASLLLASLIFLACLLIVSFTVARLGVARQRQLGHAAASAKEVHHVRDECRRQYEQLTALGQALVSHLDKRMIVQAIAEATSRATSMEQADSVVSCWLYHIESDTIRFETGFYCDEATFTQANFQLTELPFARVISTQKPWLISSVAEELGILKPYKRVQLGSLTGAIIVPHVIEQSVLGVTVILCHADVLKRYADQGAYYDALWAELTLAMAIAIQGEVAILDRLTGVHNREYFMKRFHQEVERANRFHVPLSVLMIDIDNFKAVNDTLGHPQGDAVLRIIAKEIKRAVRAIDLVGRYGGEEFIVLLPETVEDAASGSGTMVVAERIRKSVEENFQGMQKPLNLTVSLGAIQRRYPEDRDLDYRELIRLADEQLYRAKTTGKNRVCMVEHQPAGKDAKTSGEDAPVSP